MELRAVECFVAVGPQSSQGKGQASRQAAQAQPGTGEAPRCAAPSWRTHRQRARGVVLGDSLDGVPRYPSSRPTAFTEQARSVSGRITPDEIARRVLSDPTFQESHWLEFKSSVDLRDRGWQARVAKFILGAANRPHEVAASTQNGAAFIVLGVEPGRAIGTVAVDPAIVQSGLKRFLGGTGPAYLLDYVPLEDTTVAVLTVQAVRAGSRPYLARGTLSDEKKVVLQDGRIYVRRTGATEEASAAEVDDMLTERMAARLAAGGRGWPAEPVVDAWRVGRTIYLRRERGDELVIEDRDSFTNLGEMARNHPPVPWPVAPSIAERVSSIFGPLLALADTDPARAVEEAWQPLRAITLEVHAQLLGTPPRLKVIDIVAELAAAGHVDGGWIDVAYPLYYWATASEREEQGVQVGKAKTYLHLAEHLATALLHASEDRSDGLPSGQDPE